MFTALYVIGITAEAMTAALSAGRQKMDLFGVLFIAAITALGGGSVRDMLLGNYPLTWVEHPKYLVIVLSAALLTVWMAFLMHYFRHVFLVLDGLGLAVFAVLGTQVALGMGYGFVVAAVASIVTGVSGGIMRDLLCDRVPLVLSKELYAFVALCATGMYMLLLELGVHGDAAALSTVLAAFALRLAAIYFKLHLPVFEYRGKDQPVDPRLRLSARVVYRGAKAVRRGAGAAVHKLPATWPRKGRSQYWEFGGNDTRLEENPGRNAQSGGSA